MLACVPWFLCGETLSGAAAHAGPLASPVVGGTPVAPGEWPDVAAVFMADGGMCSGTLLAADLVLTAGHCIEGGPREVVIGSTDVSEPDGQWRRVKWARAYPTWWDRYDVAVVMLENPVLARQRAVAQDCTPLRRIVPGAQLQLVGFGLTTPSGTGTNTRLHQASLDIVDAACTADPACNAEVAPHGELTAGGGGRDACYGDSGGPVYIATASGPALAGIVSRGLLSNSEPCGGGGVFVRADKVVAWIQSVTGRKIERVSCAPPAGDDDGRTGEDETGSGDPGGEQGSDEHGDDDDRPPSSSVRGCAAGGGVAGILQCGLVVLYGLGYARVLRAHRRRRTARAR